MQATHPTAFDRLVYIDWVRIIAFGLLVLYHVGMYYVSWDWHVKSPHAGAALEPLMRAVSPWRMDLLFLVSGVATAFMLRRGGASAGLLGARARRLLLPLLFGMLVIVPPQSYLEVVQRHGFAGNYLEFLRLYFTGYEGFCRAGGSCLILPTWNHLWFLPYLFVYTLVAWLALRRWPLSVQAIAPRLSRALRGWRFFAAPVLLLTATTVLLKPRFPVTHALVDDLFAHVQYFAMFALGLVFANAPALQQRMQQTRWFALSAALVGWTMLVGDVLPAPGSGALAGVARALAFTIVQWGGIVAALGFARRHLGRDGAARRYLTDAVFPVYILHQTLTIVLARTLAPAGLAPALEGTLLVAGTLAASFAGYEIVRRLNWARPLFGLKAGAAVVPTPSPALLAAALTIVATLMLAACGGDDDEARDEATAQSLHVMLAQARARNPHWPGVAAIVTADKGAFMWTAASGHADAATGRPLTTDATFRTASITKTFTAASIYRLAELGALDVDEPIARHLSPVTLALLRAAGYEPQQILVDDLLAHKAGLRDYATAPEYFAAVLAEPGRRWSREDQIAFAMTLGAPLAPPGGSYAYSDTGYLLLGEIIEAKTGLQLGAAYRSLLALDAIGLRSTWQESIDPVPPLAGPRAMQYLEPGIDTSAIDASVDLWGGGGLVSDLRDLATFFRALLEGRVLEETSLRKMIALGDALSSPAAARGMFRIRADAEDCWATTASGAPPSSAAPPAA